MTGARFLALCLAVAGCRPAVAPAPCHALLIDCEDLARCFARAATLCPEGYHIDETRTTTSGYAIQDGLITMTGRREIFVDCDRRRD